jgi:hypothetical protein
MIFVGQIYPIPRPESNRRLAPQHQDEQPHPRN